MLDQKAGESYLEHFMTYGMWIAKQKRQCEVTAEE